MEMQEQIDHELAMGDQARSAGFEARARVCARRAVGIALRAHFAQRSELAGLSVVDLIQAYQEQPELSSEIRAICAHLLIRVNPDYQLPIPVDLLTEAKILIDFILENQKPS